MITSTDRDHWQDQAADAERFLTATDKLIRARLDDAGLLGSGRRTRHDGPSVEADEDDGELIVMLPRPGFMTRGYSAGVIYDRWLEALAIVTRTVTEEMGRLP